MSKHRRGPHSSRKYQERKEIRRALLSGSFHDRDVAEIVFTQEFEKNVDEQINHSLGCTIPGLAGYGDVLVHRGVESPDLDDL